MPCVRCSVTWRSSNACMRLTLHVSLDHYTRKGHERVRGEGSFAPALAGLSWLARKGFALTVAARFSSDETEDAFRAGFAALFRHHGLELVAYDPEQLVLFPELSDEASPPEVSQTCWQA